MEDDAGGVDGGHIFHQGDERLLHLDAHCHGILLLLDLLLRGLVHLVRGGTSAL